MIYCCACGDRSWRSTIDRTAGNGVQDGGEPTVAAYAYDALGRRVRRIDYVTGGTTATTVKYYYDGQNVVAEFDGSTTPVLQRYYIHGATYIDERAVMRDAVNGQDFYYFLRELCTVDGLVNNRGHEVERYLYDAYGKASIVTVNIHDLDFNGTVNAGDRGFVMTGTAACDDPITDLDANGVINAADKGFITANYGPALVASKVSGVDNPYLFTGRDLDVYYNGPTDAGDDVDFAVQYNRARYYDAENGRWLGRDPAEYVDGWVLYEYARGNPVKYFDAGGMSASPSYTEPKVAVCGKWRVCPRRGKVPEVVRGEDNPKYTEAKKSGVNPDDYPGFEVTFITDDKCPDCCKKDGAIRIVQVIATVGTWMSNTSPHVDAVGIPLPQDKDKPRPGGMSTPGRAGSGISYWDGPTGDQIGKEIEACAICDQGTGGEVNLGCVTFKFNTGKPNTEEGRGLDMEKRAPLSSGDYKGCWEFASAEPGDFWNKGLRKWIKDRAEAEENKAKRKGQ